MEITNLDQNERISELEAFKEDIFNTIYPIGSLYLTFNKNFNPNDTFTGTWTRNGAKGYTLVGAIDPDDYRDPSNSILEIPGGSTEGERKHTLTINEMPSHKHSLTSWRNPTESTPQPTTGFGFTNNNYAFSNVATDGDGTRYTANDSVAIGAAGSGEAHNNVQPSIGVYIWNRIA